MLHFDMLVVFRDGEVRTIGTGWFDYLYKYKYISLNFIFISQKFQFYIFNDTIYSVLS